MLSRLAGVIKSEPSFDLVATSQEAFQALGRSSMHRPNLFLINVDEMEGLELLPQFVRMFPQADILGLMERWDQDRADQVLEAGARGCILKPFRATDVLEALRIYKRRGLPRPSRTLAFFSPKGRSGRTTMASVLAIELARKSGESVALIDADLQFGDLAMFFDVATKHNVVEATHDVPLLTPPSLEPYFHEVGQRVWLLSAPTRPEHAELVEAEKLVSVVRMASGLFRYILLDLPAGFNPISMALSECADTDILMTMLNSGQEVYHMKRANRMFHTWETYGKKVYSVFARVNPCNDDQRRKIEEAFGQPVTGIFPNEYQITAVTGSGRLLQDLPENTPLIHAIGRLADDIITGRR